MHRLISVGCLSLMMVAELLPRVGLANPRPELAVPEATALITSTTEKLCLAPSMKGKDASDTYSGKAGVGVTELLKKLAHFDVDGEVKISRSRYEGLVRDQLPAAMADTNQCKQKVFNKLVDAFSPQYPPLNCAYSISGAKNLTFEDNQSFGYEQSLCLKDVDNAQVKGNAAVR